MSTVQRNHSLFNDTSSNCWVILNDDTSAGLSIAPIVLLGNFVVGLPANVWVLWLICHGTTELLASDINVLNLAVCEILYCLGLPAQLYCMYEHLSDSLRYLLILQLFMVWVGRSMFQLCICMERYIAVVHPLIFIRIKPLKYKLAQCALCWCVALLLILQAFTLPEEAGTAVTITWFVSILCTILYCYFSVLCSLKQPGPGEKEGGKRRRGDKLKGKAFNIILVHLLCFLVNYLPVMVIQSLRKQIHISGTVIDLTMSLGVLLGHVQPLLYLHKAGKLSCLKRVLT